MHSLERIPHSAKAADPARLSLLTGCRVKQTPCREVSCGLRCSVAVTLTLT